MGNFLHIIDLKSCDKVKELWTWHRSFHPNISHPEFFPADIPPGHLTSRILPRRHSTRVSHTRNSSLPSFHLDISHPEFCPVTVPPSPDISHPEFCLADVQPSPDISYPEFCPADISPFSSSLEHFLEVPKISFSINFDVIFLSGMQPS